MARTYAKVFFDWRNQMAALSDAEKGRLYDAILEYGETGIVPQLNGRESILFPVFQSQIDRDTKAYQSKVDAGRKGGLAKAGKSWQPLAESSKSNQEEEEEKEYEKEKDINSVGAEQAAPSFILADGSVYKLTEDQVTQLVNEFPMLDCFAVLADIRRWCEANPRQRKTRAGAARFINAWFVRERDKRQQWREQAIARNKPQKKERSHKYDEIYDRY